MRRYNFVLAVAASAQFSIAFNVGSEKIASSSIHPNAPINGDCRPLLDRRDVLHGSIMVSSLLFPITASPNACQAANNDEREDINANIFELRDPDTYSAAAYIPPEKKRTSDSLNLLVLLHGAGNNQNSALYEFTNLGSSTSTPGDHTQLPLALLATNQAPPSLSDNFVVVAPYIGKGKPGSLYNEPRTKIISFIKWFRRQIEQETSIKIHPRKVSLFGFSEGATLAVELATTRLFCGVVLASYGFTGTLPKLAVERLQGIPIWAFHSIGDDVYDIQCSQRLVESLIMYQGGTDVFDVGDVVKFTKLKPMESKNDDVGREHVRAALVASRSDKVYKWLLRH